MLSTCGSFLSSSLRESMALWNTSDTSFFSSSEVKSILDVFIAYRSQSRLEKEKMMTGS